MNLGAEESGLDVPESITQARIKAIVLVCWAVAVSDRLAAESASASQREPNDEADESASAEVLLNMLLRSFVAFD